MKCPVLPLVALVALAASASGCSGGPGTPDTPTVTASMLPPEAPSPAPPVTSRPSPTALPSPTREVQDEIGGNVANATDLVPDATIDTLTLPFRAHPVADRLAVSGTSGSGAGHDDELVFTVTFPIGSTEIADVAEDAPTRTYEAATTGASEPDD